MPAIWAAFPVTNVCREAEVLPQSGVIDVSARNQIEAIDWSIHCVGADLGDDRVRALSDIHCALVQSNAAILFAGQFGRSMDSRATYCRTHTTFRQSLLRAGGYPMPSH